YLRPEARGRGLADSLLTAVIDEARPRVAQLDLVVTAQSSPAIRLYARHGFVAVGYVPRGLRIDGRDHDDLLMQLDLDPAASPAQPQPSPDLATRRLTVADADAFRDLRLEALATSPEA